MAVMRLSCLFVNGGDSSTIRSMISHDSSDSPGDAHSGLPMARVKGALWPNARKVNTRAAANDEYLALRSAPK